MNSITLKELLILAFLPLYQSFVAITMRHKDYECWLEAIQSGTQVQEKPVPLVRRLSDGSRHGRAALSLTAGIKYVLKWRRLPAWSHLTPDTQDQLATCSWTTLTINGEVLGEGLVSDVSHQRDQPTLDRIAASPEVMGRPLVFELEATGTVPLPLVMRNGRLTLTLHRSREVLRRALKGRAHSDVAHLMPASRASPVHGSPPPSVPPTIFNWYFEVVHPQGYQRQRSGSNKLRHSISLTLAKLSTLSLHSASNHGSARGSTVSQATDYGDPDDPSHRRPGSPETPKASKAGEGEGETRERGASESTVVPTRRRRPSANLSIENGRLLVLSLDRDPLIRRDLQGYETPVSSPVAGKRTSAQREILRRSISSPMEVPTSMPRPSPTTLQSTRPMVPSQPLRPFVAADLRDHSDPLSFSTPSNPGTGTTIATTSGSSGQRLSGTSGGVRSPVVRSPGGQAAMTSPTSLQRAHSVSSASPSSPLASSALSPRASTAAKHIHYASNVNHSSPVDPRRSQPRAERARAALGYVPGRNPLLVAAEVATTARKNSLQSNERRSADVAVRSAASMDGHGSYRSQRTADSMGLPQRKVSMPDMISRLRKASMDLVPTNAASNVHTTPSSTTGLHRVRAVSQPAPPPMSLSMLLRPVNQRRGSDNDSAATTRTRGGTVVQKPSWGQSTISIVRASSQSGSGPVSPGASTFNDLPPPPPPPKPNSYASPRGSRHSSNLSDGTIDRALRQVYDELADRGRFNDTDSVVSSPSTYGGLLPPINGGSRRPKAAGDSRPVTSGIGGATSPSSSARPLSWVVDGQGDDRRRSTSSTTVDAPLVSNGFLSQPTATSIDGDADDEGTDDHRAIDEQSAHSTSASSGALTPSFSRVVAPLLTPVTETLEESNAMDRNSLRGSMIALGSPATAPGAWQQAHGLGITSPLTSIDASHQQQQPSLPERESSLARMRKRATSLKDRSVVSVEELEERLKDEGVAPDAADDMSVADGEAAHAQASRPAHDNRMLSSSTFGATSSPVRPISPAPNRVDPALSASHSQQGSSSSSSSTALLSLLAELHKLKERETELLAQLNGREDEAHEELQTELRKQAERVKRLSGDVKTTVEKRQRERASLIQQQHEHSQPSPVVEKEMEPMLPDEPSGGHESIDNASHMATPSASLTERDTSTETAPSEGSADTVPTFDTNPVLTPTFGTQPPQQAQTPPRSRPQLQSQREELSLELVKQMRPSRHRRISSDKIGSGGGNGGDLGSCSSMASSAALKSSGPTTPTTAVAPKPEVDGTPAGAMRDGGGQADSQASAVRDKFEAKARDASVDRPYVGKTKSSETSKTPTGARVSPSQSRAPSTTPLSSPAAPYKRGEAASSTTVDEALASASPLASPRTPPAPPTTQPRPAISALVGHLRHAPSSSSATSKWSQPSWSAPTAATSEPEVGTPSAIASSGALSSGAGRIERHDDEKAGEEEETAEKEESVKSTDGQGKEKSAEPTDVKRESKTVSQTVESATPTKRGSSSSSTAKPRASIDSFFQDDELEDVDDLIDEASHDADGDDVEDKEKAKESFRNLVQEQKHQYAEHKGMTGNGSKRTSQSRPERNGASAEGSTSLQTNWT
ncbi:hypothetical protein BDZ90DRAFT_280951, partial [Jaminaea rosea]